MIVLANDERGSTDTSRLDFSNDDLSCRLKTERAIVGGAKSRMMLILKWLHVYQCPKPASAGLLSLASCMQAGIRPAHLRYKMVTHAPLHRASVRGFLTSLYLVHLDEHPTLD